jgi:hypothetical protein
MDRHTHEKCTIEVGDDDRERPEFGGPVVHHG